MGLIMAFGGGMILPLFYLFTPIFNFADFELPFPAGFGGTCLTVPALWLFWRSHKDLDRQWSPKLEIRESHRLITKGIYCYIRHPMYSSTFLAALCQLLLIGNWIVGPSYMAGFGLLYITRISREESQMLEEFGEEYKEYMKTTNRLIPTNRQKQ